MPTSGHGATYRLSSLTPKPTAKRPRALSESDSQPHLQLYSEMDGSAHAMRKSEYETRRNAGCQVEQNPSIFKPGESCNRAMDDQDMTLVDGMHIGLSELVLRENLPKAKNELAVNQPSLGERVEPLLQDLHAAYAQEWDHRIKMHKQELDETTQHLGDLVDRQSLAIIDALEQPVTQFWRFSDAYTKATYEENDGFLERARNLLAEQQSLFRKLDENSARIEQRSNQLAIDLTSIRSLTQAALSGCDDEYNEATKDIEKKVKALKSDKDLNNDFTKYMMKCMSAQAGPNGNKGGRRK